MNGKVKEWLSKEDERPDYYRNRVNAGLHVISPAIFAMSGIDAEIVGTIDSDGKPIKVDLGSTAVETTCWNWENVLL